MPHSKNKQAFLKGSGIENGAYQLLARDIEPLIRHYAEKKGIRIIKNGQVNSSFIRQKQAEINLTIQKLEDSSIKYATYLQKNFSPYGPALANVYSVAPLRSLFDEHYSVIKTSIKKYLNSTGHLRKDLSTNELHAINVIISQLSCKELFDKQIESKIEDLKKSDLPDACLTKPEAMQEVEEIRGGLKEDEIVAYIFTSIKNISIAHLEVLIITKKAIIKPVIWNDRFDAIQSMDTLAGIPLYEPNLYSFLTKYDAPEPRIQADGISCGSLGIASLKKLLQNNALELKSFTLTFSFYHPIFAKKIHFFFPSPSMLRYAQSSKYILFLEKILQNADTADYEGNKLFTLKALLTQSIQISTENKDMATVEENSKLLDELPIFRQKWLNAMEEIKQQRDKMACKNPKSGVHHNLYLAYTSRRLEKITKQAPPSSSSFFRSAFPIDSTEIESSVNTVANKL